MMSIVVECPIVRGSWGPFYRRSVTRFTRWVRVIVDSTEYHPKLGTTRFVGDNSDTIGPIEVIAQTPSWAGGVACRRWRE
jgi:hypothetical protein